MGKYILNQETQKIELHFEKSDYMALSEELKKKINSNFLWSNKNRAWVSRSTKNHYWALKVAEMLGLENGGKEGERLSYAEQLERKADRAEVRAERFETYADNAERRGNNLSAALDAYRGDIAFFTQPIIAGHSGSQAFARRREKIFQRYRKGLDEYRKSDYFRDRATTAKNTASMDKLKDRVYLHNRIKEQNATIKKLQGNIVTYEDRIFRIQNGEVLKNYHNETLTVAQIETWLESSLEKMEYELDKLAFFENTLDDLGGIQFSQDNIKVGYIVKVKNSGRCEIVSAGPVNVKYKILDGGAAGMVLTDPYAAITEILAVKETPKVVNPYQVGDILCKYRPAGNSIYKAYQVIKTTAMGVKIQQIAVEKGVPVPGKFTDEKPMQKKITKSMFRDFVGIYDDNWQLDKYIEKEAADVI
ncbi:MAG: DUF3560 domain-containing protein [Clostridia bacterium]